MPRLYSSAGNHPFDSNASIGRSVEVDLDGLIRSSSDPKGSDALGRYRALVSYTNGYAG